ncbi:MAG TPA: hypothetical protein VFV54_04195 [Thermoanaerobaculia bacterium]|nr:hypothetical protein [Thermoanaerobaculia bacterium]
MSAATAEEFRRVMFLVVGTGVLAFGVSGTLLVFFFRSLQRESREGERRLTTRSALLLVGVLVSLLFFSLLFAGIAYF